MIGLQDKRVVVTGGGRGIGLAICTAIIDAGGQVAVLDVLAEPHPDCRVLEKSGRLSYIRCDITKREPLETGFAQCIEALGGHLDGCVTNAGIGTDKPFLDHTWEDFERVVKVNQNGTFFPAQLAVKQFLSQLKPQKGKSRGSLVMIASQAASNKCPGHFLTAYGGSKGFVKSFAMQLSHEMATTGIRVNSVSPGYIETDLNLDLAKIKPEVSYYFNEAPPMKRLGLPADIAGGCVYMLSDAAGYVTGQNLSIDGGMSAGSGLTR